MVDPRGFPRFPSRNTRHLNTHRFTTAIHGEPGQALIVVILGFAALALIVTSALTLLAFEHGRLFSDLAQTQADDASVAGLTYGRWLVGVGTYSDQFSFGLSPATVQVTLTPSQGEVTILSHAQSGRATSNLTATVSTGGGGS